MTLAELRRVVELLPRGASLTLPREALLEALADAHETDAGPESPTAEADRLLPADDVATLLGTSVRWVYDHQAQLGGRRLSRRCLRFPESAVRRYVERRQ